MAANIYLSPSSQPANTYAVGDTNEQVQCRRIAAELETHLRRCGFPVLAGMEGTMYTRVAQSNDWGADLHLCIHTNAFDGKVAGLRIMISKKGGEAEEIAQAIMETLAPITPGQSDGISQYPGLYEIQNTRAICVYVEVGFHDNPQEAQWIIDNTETVAAAMAQALCSHYGVTWVPVEKTVYRVQVGAFYTQQYAEDLRRELEDKGYDAFVVEGNHV